MTQSQHTQDSRVTLVIGLAIIVIIATAVRFFSLRMSPPWYTDEAFYLNVAWELIHGHAQVSGISQWTFISAFSPVPPLFHFMVGSLLLIFGKSLFVARMLTASIGVITAGSLAYIGYSMFRSKLAGLVMGLAYATIPIIVVNNRWAHPQNLAGLLLLWAVYFFWRFIQSKRRAYEFAGCLVAGAAFMTSYWCWGFLVAVFIVYRGLERRRAWQAAGMILAVPLGMLIIRGLIVPVAFWTDLTLFGLNFYTVNNSAPLWLEFLVGTGQYFTRDPLFFLAIIGMLFIRPYRLRIFLLSFFFFSSFVLLTKRSSFAAWFYSGLTFTPLVLLGLGAGIQTIQQQFGKYQRKLVAIVTIAVCLYSATQVWGIFYALSRNSLATLATQRILFIIRQDEDQIEQITNYINSHTTKADFVIAPNALNWQFQARSAEAMWVACYEHQQEFGPLFDDRFPWPMGAHNAAFLVDDILFGGDAGICQEQRHEIIDTVSTERWPMVFSTNRFQVYQNPNVATNR